MRTHLICTNDPIYRIARQHDLVRNNMHATSFNILLGPEICAISLEHDKEIENTSYFVRRDVKALVYCTDKTRMYIAFVLNTDMSDLQAKM